MLREALTRMGRADLIGPGKDQLIPLHQPATDSYQSARRKNSTPAGSHKVAKETTKILTQHTGLPPRGSDGSNPWDKREQAKAAAQARNKQAAKERSDAAKGKGGNRPASRSCRVDRSLNCKTPASCWRFAVIRLVDILNVCGGLRFFASKLAPQSVGACKDEWRLTG
jgi:hypothetical protein